MNSDWRPPETAPKDGKAFLVTTVNEQIDICWWDGKAFRDYYFKQEIISEWPYMIGWKPLGEPAKMRNSESDTRIANGWEIKL